MVFIFLDGGETIKRILLLWHIRITEIPISVSIKFYWNPAATVIYLSDICDWFYSTFIGGQSHHRNCMSRRAKNIHSLPLYRKSLLIPTLDTKDLGGFFFIFFFLVLALFSFFLFFSGHNYPDKLQVETQTKWPNGLSLGSRVQEGISRNAGAFKWKIPLRWI